MGATTAQALLIVLEKEMSGPAFKQIQISAALSRLAKLRGTIDADVRNSEVLAALVEKLLLTIEAHELDARQSANSFWALVKLKDDLPEVSRALPPLMAYLEARVLELEAQGASIVLWACATYGPEKFAVARLLHLLAERIADCAERLDAQEVANVAWATAKLRLTHPQLLHNMPLISEVAVAKAAHMTAQGLANFLWAAATVADRAPLSEQAVAAVAQAVPGKVPDMVPQNVANLMWAIAVLQERVPQVKSLMPMLAKAAASRAQGFKQQELPMIMWSAAHTGLDLAHAEPLFRALAGPVIAVVGSFTAEQFATCCCGMAYCRWQSASTMKHMAAAILQKLPAWTDEDFLLNAPQVAWAFARLRLRHSSLLRAIAGCSATHLRRMNDWSVCALAWSYRELDTQGEFAPFCALVAAELARRRMEEEHVGQSGAGLDAWLKLGIRGARKL